jgi:hypothetical protein
MEFDRDYEPDYEPLKALLLEMAQEHAVTTLLEMIVRQLARRPQVALARIWLLHEGDCPCPKKESVCDDNTKCVHLVASEGRSWADKDADWSRLNGNVSRFALGPARAWGTGLGGRTSDLRLTKSEFIR